jgi:hypothetical protein
MTRRAPQVGDEVFYQGGNGQRRQRFSIIAITGSTAVLSRPGAEDLLVGLTELEPLHDVKDKPAASRARRRSVWLIYVPQGGQPKHRRSPKRHS